MSARAGMSLNKYLSIGSRAVIQALKEEPRVKAERRISEMSLRYQVWQQGKAGEQTYVQKPVETGN